MRLVQLLLPLFDNEGRPQPEAAFRQVADEMAERFGGLTAFTRAPAEGLWKAGGAKAERDDIVVFEVMTDDIEHGWWKRYRRELERRFKQESIVIRAQAIELL